MSSHIGVSCDSCLKTNFSDRRYKCLQCDNYDLCGSCFDVNAQSQNHIHTHPMQCILTKKAYELFYEGESISYRTIVSLTCPYCGISGFTSHTLLMHCLEKHCILSSENKTSQLVICPICVINPLGQRQARFVSLADHMVREHDNENLSISQIQRYDDKKEDTDQVEDEELPLYILAERLFNKDENRRQEIGHQKFMQTTVRKDCGSVTNRNLISQHRPISRQSAIRCSRGNMRGHYNDYPYGNVPHPTACSLRIAFDPSAENTISSDPYTTIFIARDSLFDIDSLFSDLSTNPRYFVTSSVSTHIPILETTNNNRINQKKSSLSTTKQKCSHPIQQQSTQTVVLTGSSTSNNHLWRPDFTSPSHNLNFSVDTNRTTENNKIDNYASKNAVNDSRSLLGKRLKIDDGNESTTIHFEGDHLLFLQSLLLSLMNINNNNEQLH